MNKSFPEHLNVLFKYGKIIFFCFMIFSIINYFIAKYFIDSLTTQYTITTIKPIETLSTILTLDIVFSFSMTLPIALFLAFKYISPVFKNKKVLWVIYFISLSLFTFGGIFAYFIYNKFVLNYFINLTESVGLMNIWTI